MGAGSYERDALSGAPRRPGCRRVETVAPRVRDGSRLGPAPGFRSTIRRPRSSSCRGYRPPCMPARAPDPDRFRAVVGHFATGVTVVTYPGPSGPAGLTTNAVTSLSLDPLLMLVCFARGSRTLTAVRSSRRFAVNVLRSDQEDLARVFASKRVATEKFEAV